MLSRNLFTAYTTCRNLYSISLLSYLYKYTQYEIIVFERHV